MGKQKRQTSKGEAEREMIMVNDRQLQGLDELR